MTVHTTGFVILATFLIGCVAGMRTMMPLAALGILGWRRPELFPDTAPASWFAHAAVAIVFVLLSLGELVGDKLPQTPNRIALAPFLARLVSGAVAGAAVAQIAHTAGWAGAVTGGIGAVVSTLGMFYARRNVVRALRVRDPFVGAAEDVLAIVVSAGVLAMIAS